MSGDIVSHADWDYTPETHQDMIRNISDLFKKYLPGIGVYFTIGNHEGKPVMTFFGAGISFLGAPIDNIGPHYVPARFQPDWLYGSIAESWKDWVPEDQQDIIR